MSAAPPVSASAPLPPRGNDIRELLQLAWPMLIGQVAQVAMGVLDTIMAGAVSATDLAAVAVGFSLWLPLTLLGNGIFTAVTALIARALGAGQPHSVARHFQQALWLAIGVGALNTVLVANSGALLTLMGVDPHVRPLGELYLRGIAVGMPAAALLQVLRAFSEGSGRSKPVMLVNVGALLINIPLNYIFIHGLFGAPKLGGAGCGIATGISLWVNFFALALLLLPRYRPLLRDFRRPDWSAQWRIVQLGFPIGAAVFAEVSLFALVALLIGHLGATTIASHQIALNFSALTFMVPSSLGLALTVKIGHCIGAGELARARRYTRSGLAMAIAFAMCSASLMLLFPSLIARIYTADPTVIALTAQLLFFAAIYQLSDGLQVVAAGCLRGYHDTRIVMVITLIAYWGIGLPAGYALGLTDLLVPMLGARGLWIGLVLGLTVAAVLLNWRLHRISGNGLAKPESRP